MALVVRHVFLGVDLCISTAPSIPMNKAYISEKSSQVKFDQIFRKIYQQI
jgi:hypothetical protein